MTSKEILGADILDILFENRNKDYGAYPLRRNYNHRLLLAMGATLSIILLFILLAAFRTKKPLAKQQMVIGPIIEIQNVKPPKPLEPEVKAPISKPVQHVASIRYTNINIKPKVVNRVAEIEEIKGKEISTITSTGIPSIGLVKPVEPIQPSGGTKTGPVESTNRFDPNEIQPEFPGGPEALRRFLANNLNTPEDLEINEKKTVQIRFTVGADGLVTNIEILASAGNSFDREVIRVCKKMPRWKPAFQNSGNVAVSYILPVTFVGVEQ